MKEEGIVGDEKSEWNEGIEDEKSEWNEGKSGESERRIIESGIEEEKSEWSEGIESERRIKVENREIKIKGGKGKVHTDIYMNLNSESYHNLDYIILDEF